MRKYILPTLVVLGLLSPIVVLEAAGATHPTERTGKHEMQTHYQLLAFFEERAPNPASSSSEGKSFNEIMRFDDVQLEREHDFIQALFPTFEKSAFNLSAPTITPAEIDAIKNSNQAMHNYKFGLQKMCEFYGMTYDMETGVISYPAGFKKQGKSHNLYRLTRILTSLRLFSMLPEAESLLANLEDIYDAEEFRESRGYWKRAVYPEQLAQSINLNSN